MTTNYRSVRPLINIWRLWGRALSAFLLAAVAVYAQFPSENDRLIQTARVWIAVKYFHPYLANREIDWNKALLDALPKIREAKSDEEYASALRSMLAVLQDPATSLLAAANEFPPGWGGSAAQRIWMHRGFPPESGANRGPFYSAFICCAGPFNEAVRIPLGNGFDVFIRLGENPNDTVQPSPKPDTYPDASYPLTEYRILAAFKTWGVIHHFFAYRDLMDEDWDDVFASFLPRFVAAKDAREYNLAVADMLTHTLDSHATVKSDELDDYFGRATVGLRLRLIEKKPVVTAILDANAKSAGLRIGDIVVTVDNERIADRFNRIQDYIAGSTPQRRGFDSIKRVLDGADGSTATLTIASGDGQTKEIKLQRSIAFLNERSDRDKPEAVRKLSDNIGYVDLTRVADQQAILEKLQNTRGIIFDARGEIGPAAKTIPSHLTSAKDVAGAIITGPIALSPDVITTATITSTASYFFVEKVPEAAPKYTGNTVMLIDERTIGEAEHLGLWMEAANKTKFIGTASAGAESVTTNFLLPGGITVTFSAQDVRHGNTGKLQRVGLEPEVVVGPTIAGIRAGRDEVLDKAISYLSGSGGHR